MVTGGTLGSGLARRAGSAYSFASRIPVVGPVLTRTTAEAIALGEQALAGALELTRAALKVIIREVIEALVVEVDLTELVKRHVDINEIATVIDLDTIAARIDIDAILNRVDLDAVIETVDLNRAVSGVDLDAIAAKIDIEAVIGRVDLIGLANEIIDGVDLQAIVRESTTTLTTGVLDDVRTQGARADDVVAGVFGRLLGRSVPPPRGRPGLNGTVPAAAAAPNTATSVTEVVVDVHRRDRGHTPLDTHE
ncbi:MAG: hypothetical protein C0482_29055 [Gordonia sp.]|jgi:hypothetical protein|uniref:Uncharacterized protein n=1 Tax=Gordonia rubripertincta TaxID=36822 RepID=A0ABT4N047_GORRU|nr:MULTISPECIES: hypothetical protein [Mycobacteriales]MBA4026410.1 hypothetical protein [Gordonia sp. (in: high G+C Gram-positive bacteria)]MCZ4552429.1 hypothetical protein [Gordonia rubripertincta]OZG26542.1 hypothetical protein BH683_024670 [Williamsia sp. 1138]